MLIGQISMKEKFMFLPLDQKIFKIMFEIKSNSLESILQQYDIGKQSLYDQLWEEFNIPGMEVRIANTAFDFLIDCCEEKKDLCETLKGEIKKNILMAGNFIQMLLQMQRIQQILMVETRVLRNGRRENT